MIICRQFLPGKNYIQAVLYNLGLLVPEKVLLECTSMRLFFSQQYLASECQFYTNRKAGWIVDSLKSNPIPGVVLTEPLPLTVEEIATVHDKAYIEAIRTGKPIHLAQSQGFEWGQGLFPAVCASNGGIVAAALEALQTGLSGSLSSGLHHARRDRGNGFCTFNGLVIAAKKALEAGANSVAILDLDAHCGGGTASLIQGFPKIRQMDVSMNGFDRYESTENCNLYITPRAGDYMEAMDKCLNKCLKEPPDLVIYNAGMDPFRGCSIDGSIGVCEATLHKRDHIIINSLRRQGIPIAFALAGGYVGLNLSQEGLVKLHRFTIEIAEQATTVPSRKKRRP
jgi:acetoin utilization deacetylase AcuC-like enzyme